MAKPPILCRGACSLVWGSKKILSFEGDTLLEISSNFKYNKLNILKGWAMYRQSIALHSYQSCAIGVIQENHQPGEKNIKPV